MKKVIAITIFVMVATMVHAATETVKGITWTYTVTGDTVSISSRSSRLSRISRKSRLPRISRKSRLPSASGFSGFVCRLVERSDAHETI